MDSSYFRVFIYNDLLIVFFFREREFIYYDLWFVHDILHFYSLFYRQSVQIYQNNVIFLEKKEKNALKLHIS